MDLEDNNHEWGNSNTEQQAFHISYFNGCFLSSANFELPFLLCWTFKTRAISLVYQNMFRRYWRKGVLMPLLQMWSVKCSLDLSSSWFLEGLTKPGGKRTTSTHGFPPKVYWKSAPMLLPPSIKDKSINWMWDLKRCFISTAPIKGI